MGSTKTFMTLWIRCKKSIEPLIELDPEYLEDVQDIWGNAVNKGRPASLVNASSQEIGMYSFFFFFFLTPLHNLRDEKNRKNMSKNKRKK